jgi:lysylphosphatidylglycerol synthetase-like protein (DUF2156 family)
MKEKMKSLFCRVSLAERIISASALCYIIAFVVMARQFDVQKVEFAFLVLIVLVVGSIVYKMFAVPSRAIKISISVVTVIVALAISARYFSYFVTDLKYISILLLFVSSVGLVAGAVISLPALKATVMEKEAADSVEESSEASKLESDTKKSGAAEA